MIPTKYQDESATIKHLLALGNPHKLEGGVGREWPDYLASGFTESDVPVLIQILTDKDLMYSQNESDEIYAFIHAWRVLGQLESVEAIGPLISVIETETDDDWVLTEVPKVMGMIGKQAIKPLADYMLGDVKDEFSKANASDCLKSIATEHPEQRDTVLDVYSQYLKAPDPTLQSFNGLLVCNLLDLKATELIDQVRPMYEKGYVDITTSGDLEDVEIALGLRSQRDTPKPNYANPRLAALGKLLGAPPTSAPGMGFGTKNPFVRDAPKLGRNDPCHCGSGKKYKKCCIDK